MVFQSYALYRRLIMRDSIAFPLRMRRLSRADRETRENEIARTLDLPALLEHRPARLSSGQRQRATLGWAVVRSPPS